MTEIFLLGSFHFMESDIDFFSKDIQSELQQITDSVCIFNPDKIAVEATVNAQKSIDDRYNKFCLGDLYDRDKMESDTLRNIKMFGQVYPITYNNESIQIAYRLGKMLNIVRYLLLMMIQC